MNDYHEFDDNPLRPALGSSRRHDDDRERRVGALVRDVAGPAPMPADVADRIRSRLHDEIAPEVPDRASLRRRTGAGPGHGGLPPDRGPDPVRRTRPVPDRPPRDRRIRVRRGATFLAAAAVIGLLVTLPIFALPGAGPVPVAADTPDALRHAATNATPAVDDGWARACLTAAGAADPDAPLLAGRPYPVAGEQGVLLVLATREPGRHRLVVVPADCAPGRARVLAETTTR